MILYSQLVLSSQYLNFKIHEMQHVKPWRVDASLVQSLLEDINWLLMAGEIPGLLSMRLRQEVHKRMKEMFTKKFHEHTAKLSSDKRGHHHNQASHNHESKPLDESPSADDSVPIRYCGKETVGVSLRKRLPRFTIATHN